MGVALPNVFQPDGNLQIDNNVITHKEERNANKLLLQAQTIFSTSFFVILPYLLGKIEKNPRVFFLSC